MDILLAAHYMNFDFKTYNSRFDYLARLFAKNGHSVEVVTSDFIHAKKAYRDIDDAQKYNPGYKVTLLHEPEYRKNLSAHRCIGHCIFSKRFYSYLGKRNKPDVIYCAIPTLGTAFAAARYAHKNNIPLIIDVQDLWPEAFKMIFSLPVLSDVLLLPLELEARYVYKAADAIIAVSQTYADRALKDNRKCKTAHSVYLGTELKRFDNAAKEYKIEKPDDEIWFAYVGTLGHSYNLSLVFDAIKLLEKDYRIVFQVIGDGDLKNEFENYAKSLGINVNFTGRLEYGKMAGLLSVCDIAVNPINKGAAASIINKVSDYAAAGIPVLNTQEEDEYRQLVDAYEIGYNCSNDNAEDLACKATILCRDRELRIQMGKNNRKLAKEKFDREKTYLEILDVVENMGGYQDEKVDK